MVHSAYWEHLIDTLLIHKLVHFAGNTYFYLNVKLLLEMEHLNILVRLLFIM